MAIELNKYGKKPEYNPDEYFKKFIPLIIKNAPEYDNFWLHNLVKGFKLSKTDQLIFDDMEHDLKVKLDSIGLAKLYPNGLVCLTDKGRDKKNGTESHNIISKYQKIHIGLTCVAIISSIFLGSWNILLNSQKSDLKNDNTNLTSDLELCKDSLNTYKVKALSKTNKNEHDSLPSKN